MLRKIKIRDRKAPRFRWSKDRHIVLSKELFEDYRKTVEKPVEDYNLFHDIIEDFNEEIKKESIENRDGVKLPALMGMLGICSYKNKRRPPVDWSKSEENGVKLKEYNLHTAGLACKIVYSIYNAKYKFRNWTLWRFEGNRDFKTRVSSAFIKNYNFYKRMDNKSHISKMFKDDYITTNYSLLNDNIGTNIEHQGNEQNDQCGQQDHGSIHLQ